MLVPHHVALVAHDNKKSELLEWARFNRGSLAKHHLYATGTTGTMLGGALDLPVSRFLSGPSEVTSRSAPRSPKVPSTSWCSSGTRSRRNHTTRT